MTIEEKKAIKNKIKEEIEKTRSSILDYKESTKPISPENAIGRVSRMDAINNKSVLEASLRKAEEKLTRLLVVESKVDNQDFGDCIRCGNSIPIGRILLMPQSRKCVRCAN